MCGLLYPRYNCYVIQHIQDSIDGRRTLSIAADHRYPPEAEHRAVGDHRVDCSARNVDYLIGSATSDHDGDARNTGLDRDGYN